jgi:manganese/zinc/iron transport system permease protein
MQVLATDEVQFLTLSAIAISCSLIGPFLVLKKMAMFANSLAHTILVGIVCACLVIGTGAMFDVTHLLVGALCAALLTALCTEGLVKYFRLTEDASVGLIFTSLFAAGILLVTMCLRDVHLGLESVMGNADVLSVEDLKTSGLLLCMNFGAIVLFYRHFQLSSFDRTFAKILGRSGTVFHFLLLFLVAITCTGAFRAVGVLLVLAFLVGPYLTARLFFHRLPQIIFAGCGIGVLASFCGVALTRHLFSVYDLPLSTGGMVVCLIGLFYCVGLLIDYFFKRKKYSFPPSGK